ncbi:DUF695 domain-containing protein [Bernardetia sp.]|uniref:DUF695 domain-containing protein n=1 Tax=Bernardetia sp. TaxID=1937974 RepID=UPI0025B97C5C|nr:DUF695 domain-containing protein [Bernardetia sp.]
MSDEETVELILTADANLSNIVFIEDCITQAPKLEGWDFKALKPASDIKDIVIEIGGNTFDEKSLYFYPTDNKDYPDEIEITVVCDDFEEKEKGKVTSGVYLFLENCLGELRFATTIDILNIETKQETIGKELIPIEKLKSYLIWREKEYREKYGEIEESTEKDNYSLLKGELPNGKPLFAIINTTALEWEKKSSCPFITVLYIDYSEANENLESGLPTTPVADNLDQIEDQVWEILRSKKGHLSIGRETADNTRKIYFASSEFRYISKVVYDVIEKYQDKFEMSYEIYMDKYWQSFERFEIH